MIDPISRRLLLSLLGSSDLQLRLLMLLLDLSLLLLGGRVCVEQMGRPKLLHADLGTGQLVSVEHSFNELFCVDDLGFSIAHHENMLILFFKVKHGLSWCGC